LHYDRIEQSHVSAEWEYSYIMTYADIALARNRMVEEQLIPRAIVSETVLDAMRNVPRHLLIPENLQSCAYDDTPLPIGLGQTISQPYIVAYMTEQLEPYPGMKVLEVGTGSGYQAAILAYLGCDVYSIELLEELAGKSKALLSDLHFNNVKVKCANGYRGWPEEAPFDAIIVTAAPETVPQMLVDQLKDGGKLMIPVGSAGTVQSLKSISKHDDSVNISDLLLVSFVPMVE